MDKLKKVAAFFQKHNLIFCLLLAILYNLIIESLARLSVVAGFQFMFESPLVFFYNAVIIFATLSIANLFKRRIFVTTMVSGLWLSLGIINGVILSNRMTPFTVYDISSLKDGLSIATNYFSKTQITEGIIGLIVLVILIITLWIFAPKRKDIVKYKRGVAVVALVITSTFIISGVAIQTGVVDTFFPNLAYGYRDNGVPYCFINTWMNTGISKENDYTKEKIDSIFTEDEMENQVGAFKDDYTGEKPNIIFLQLESLMDPLTVKGLELSEDPIPNLRKLYANYPSGKLTVPSVGAGTANTEFEVMTGMSVKFFGPGEYPYKSLIYKKTCESIPFDLKRIGYSTHAIHNHRGVFYKRNEVFPHLGFDTFTSLEYMNNVSKTPKNWARDFVLTKQITDALNSTKGPDYLYTISVQGHGSYPTEQVIDDPVITVEKAPTEALKWEYEYYVNQIHEMDEFVKILTDKLAKDDENTVLVMYGDHLPALENLVDKNLKDGRSNYQTDYVIWSNFDYEGKDQDLKSYQIGSEVLDNIGIHDGTFVTYQQNHKDDKDYLANLKLLQYDVLFGNDYIYDGKMPFEKTNMKMGVKDIKIDSIVKIGGKYYIKGENFTEYSKVNLDGEILKTTYLGPTILGVDEKIDPDSVSKMKISQVEKEKAILSTTE